MEKVSIHFKVKHSNARVWYFETHTHARTCRTFARSRMRRLTLISPSLKYYIFHNSSSKYVCVWACMVAAAVFRFRITQADVWASEEAGVR